MTRPRLLDLFCKAGGAGMGYHRAGFDVVGVDIEVQPNYPFKFIRADAVEFVRQHGSDFAAVHASPPCQGYLNLTRLNDSMGRTRERAALISVTRAALDGIGLPYVIENVEDARRHLVNPIRVCGTALGLPLRRHRLFESNVPITGLPCQHSSFTEKKYWTGWRKNGERTLSTVVQVYGNAGDKHEWPAAMGIDWMTYAELAEAVPPLYTEHVGGQLLAQVSERAA